jgi:molybdenum cofactor biosynthesis protein B
MTEQGHPVLRVVVATVTAGRASLPEDAARPVIEEVQDAKLTFVRSVVVNGEPHFIQQLVSNVSNSNEADVIVMVGGTGFGPRDFTCEALDTFLERHIEGFGEAYRQLLRQEFSVGAGAMLARATAGVYNRCLVFALPKNASRLRRAMQLIVLPTLFEAAELAAGRMPALQEQQQAAPSSSRPTGRPPS